MERYTSSALIAANIFTTIGNRCAWAASSRTPPIRTFPLPDRQPARDRLFAISPLRSRCPRCGLSAKQLSNPQRSKNLKTTMESPGTEMNHPEMNQPELNHLEGLYAGPYRLDKYLGGTAVSAV